ncbi:phosphatase PAP2 family protein [Dyadobacter sp. Leaf189]|uniref:phosphatase PAP2 family protein n=1 Tax=Dyadobacter sp. Leaf189 TaxID=1736295 RepID=UPI0006F597A6|nr:phosphatase PAP2 family protein [Dyadobacter sp. Leaf189]KQS34203.1 PA-phosphatase [Dyadobacter sp. Leaf189]
MKRSYSFQHIFNKSALLLLLGVVAVSCSKVVEEPTVGINDPSSLDQNAGNWKTYVLTSSSEIPVAAPTETTSEYYKTELLKLKEVVNALTPHQKEQVNYWGAGAVFRWNEIGRELAARYNTPPASNQDGKYPVPDAANPLADPKFPFANPPYTARALAYLSVAQYDALVAAWNYKFKYKRPAPSKSDSEIKTLLPVTDLPSYPSEDAVVAEASFQILKAMFPGEVPYLEAKLQEHKESRLWAGMNVKSDIEAGAALGKAVGEKAMARAKTDGMGAANNQAKTPEMIANAKAIGITEPWVSQEVPARPAMLPTYGTVMPWNFDRQTVATMRPSPPPAIGSEEFKKNMEELTKIAKSQTREQARIASFWSDGVGSYTPPGHWHRRAANLCHQNKFSEVRTARTLALVGTTLQDAGICCWDAKYYYYYPRPNQMDKKVKTSVGLPNFPSYTSGHSTFSGAAAELLAYIFPSEKQKLDAMANEASVSRIYGLIHYRFDCEAGLEAGHKVGEFAVARAKADGAE